MASHPPQRPLSLVASPLAPGKSGCLEPAWVLIQTKIADTEDQARHSGSCGGVQATSGNPRSAFSSSAQEGQGWASEALHIKPTASRSSTRSPPPLSSPLPGSAAQGKKANFEQPFIIMTKMPAELHESRCAFQSVPAEAMLSKHVVTPREGTLGEPRELAGPVQGHRDAIHACRGRSPPRLSLLLSVTKALAGPGVGNGQITEGFANSQHKHFPSSATEAPLGKDEAPFISTSPPPLFSQSRSPLRKRSFASSKAPFQLAWSRPVLQCRLLRVFTLASEPHHPLTRQDRLERRTVWSEY